MDFICYQDKHEYTSPNGVKSFVYLMDCMEGMKQIDFKVDLAVVDPPYGININMNMGRKRGQPKKHKDKDWDNSVPDYEYFEMLSSISINQIIWGGNYFDLGPCKHFIFWDKETPEGLSFSDGEFAWTSFDCAVRKWTQRNTQGGKIHPTQKPIALYDWIFKNYAKEGQTILDTHLGSQSSRIAAHKAGLTFIGFETDPDYFKQGCERFTDFVTAYEQQIGEEKVLKGQARLF